MTRLLTITALFALVVPAAFAVPPDASPSAAQQCKQLQSTMSAADFASAVGATAKPKSAFGKCVSMKTQQAQLNADNAAKQCKAERAANATTFAGAYGNGKNAFGKCVSAKSTQAAQAQQQATLNAAKRCKAERADTAFAGGHGGKSFVDYYGTNANKRNAFGKCVSKYAKEQTT